MAKCCLLHSIHRQFPTWSITAGLAEVLRGFPHSQVRLQHLCFLQHPIFSFVMERGNLIYKILPSGHFSRNILI